VPIAILGKRELVIHDDCIRAKLSNMSVLLIDVFYTYSYDIKSSRYLEHSKKFLIPKTESDYTGPDNNFDGFAVYGINVTDIEPIYEIRHILSDDVYNYCINTAYLPARSFVFESKLTTMLSHSVIGTDLETGDHLWTYNLEDGSNTIDCKSYGDV
jgi:hypothetical protein